MNRESVHSDGEVEARRREAATHATGTKSGEARINAIACANLMRNRSNPGAAGARKTIGLAPEVAILGRATQVWQR